MNKQFLVLLLVIAIAMTISACGSNTGQPYAVPVDSAKGGVAKWHMECKNGQCVKVTTPGTNQCTSAANCQHKECQNGCCATLMTPGTNTCTDNGNCGRCADTDGGQNFLVQGNVTETNCSASSFNGDFCSGTGVLEFYCEGNQERHIYYDCIANGYQACSNGKCSEGTHFGCVENCCAELPGPGANLCNIYEGNFHYDTPCSTCTGETDGGMNPYLKGTITNASCNAPFNYQTDYCWYGDSMIEYYCDENGMPQERYIDCGDVGMICQDGACVALPVTHTECQNCRCINVTGAGTNQCTWDGSCNNCFDSDFGQNENVSGWASGCYDGALFNYSDVCNSSASVKEYYCNGPGMVGINCSIGKTCSYGACQ